ncbi:MAG: hypothetical protein ACTHOO_01640 [Alcanivorax sp.]
MSGVKHVSNKNKEKAYKRHLHNSRHGLLLLAVPSVAFGVAALFTGEYVNFITLIDQILNFQGTELEVIVYDEQPELFKRAVFGSIGFGVLLISVYAYYIFFDKKEYVPPPPNYEAENPPASPASVIITMILILIVFAGVVYYLEGGGEEQVKYFLKDYNIGSMLSELLQSRKRVYSLIFITFSSFFLYFLIAMLFKKEDKGLKRARVDDEWLMIYVFSTGTVVSAMCLVFG